MDPKTLPDKELAIYDKIKKKYKVAFEPLHLGEKRLHLLKTTDLEALLGGKDPLKNVSEFPFWTKLWEAAMVLSLLITGLPDPKGKGKKFLELGAGLGAPGLAAAAHGFDTTLTDYEEHILDFQRVSAAANQLNNINFQIVDWLNPPEMSKFDIIVGAEILFREEFFAPLLSLLRISLKPEGVIYLAHDIRRKSVPLFLKMAESEYTIASSKRTLTSDDGEKVILLNRLTPKA